MTYNAMAALLIRERPGIGNVRIDQTRQTNIGQDGENSIDGPATFEYGGHSVACEADPRQDVDPWCVMDLVILAWLAEHGRLPLGTDGCVVNGEIDVNTFSDLLYDSSEFDEFVDFSHAHCCNWEMCEGYDDDDDDDEDDADEEE